jgi:glycosyltransferase involved in cell wall biosynthesis
MPKADLRLHSSFSDRPTNFFLKRLKARESMTEPEAAYALAKRRGMDYFTLTDSDTIAGCEMLLHHGDVFTSCETMVAFPEDDCKIKLLLFGLNDPQLQYVLRCRGNIFQVRDYLLAENIAHAVAAPLDVLNMRLNPDHVEKLLLLFDLFEARSGGQHARTNEFLTTLLDRLTPELMRDLEKKWGITPAGEKPWQKGYIGGSNDYCGQYIGLTWTEVPHVSSLAEFIAALRAGKSTSYGNHGTSLAAAHSMYRVAFQHYEKNLAERRVQEPDLLSLILSRVLQPGSQRKLTYAERLGVLWSGVRRWFRLSRQPSYVERRLIREFILAYQEIPARERLTDVPPDDLMAFDERLCSLADRIISRVSYRLGMKAAREFGRGRVGNALAIGSAILPLQAVLGPYLYSFNRLNRDRPLLAKLEERFRAQLDLSQHVRPNRKKIAWFSDTVNDVNGVSLTLNKMAAVAEQQNADLTIITSVIPEKASRGSKFLNFEPVGEIAVPDYELQKLTVPPALQMIRYLENAGFTEYVISTPGPVGLLAMLAAHLFHVPCRAIYHNDFPQHVKHITGDESLEESAWTYMRWFYGRADVVYSPSSFYRDQLIDHGFDPARLFIFNRGTDLDFFNPRHRDDQFYEQWYIRDRVVLAYIGRVSREKNLDVLLEAFASDPELTERAALVLVGDGPYLSELKKRYAHPAIAFCGFMKGKPLARAYASADIFVFPSTTDTYGNSVLEAQASGLPALVSDEGGPREIILDGDTGMVLPGYDKAAWRAAMREIVFNTEKRSRMSAAARARAATRDWTTAFLEFWEDNPYQNRSQSKPGSMVTRP